MACLPLWRGRFIPAMTEARPGSAPFDSHDDHRLVMGAAVLGLVVPGLRVANAATVGKTFPGFTALWEQMLGSPGSGAAT